MIEESCLCLRQNRISRALLPILTVPKYSTTTQIEVFLIYVAASLMISIRPFGKSLNDSRFPLKYIFNQYSLPPWRQPSLLASFYCPSTLWSSSLLGEIQPPLIFGDLQERMSWPSFKRITYLLVWCHITSVGKWQGPLKHKVGIMETTRLFHRWADIIHLDLSDRN